MVSEGAPRQWRPVATHGIVAFDFDGTLTVRDSYMAFLRWRAGAGGFAAGLARLAPATLGYAVHRDRGRLKAEATRMFLGGMSRAALSADAERYAGEVWATLIRPDALARWREHQARGERCVIVTASPELTVTPFAERLGADDLIGTRLVLDGTDRVTGAFHGDNCRGEEKVRRLREAFGPDLRLAAAYGDTSGDTAMLGIAEAAGYRVFKGRP